MTTSCTSTDAIPARSTAAEIAAAPSFGALTDERLPPNEPIGVRTALTITAWSISDEKCLLATVDRGAFERERPRPVL
jgi:hypothetical protein